MLKTIVLLLAAAIISLLLVLSNGLEHSTWIDFLVHIIAAIFLIFLKEILSNIDYVWLYIITKTKFRNKKIRFSISYLYRIKVLDKYLLIKGKRVPNQYQPVGGVYKRERESFYALQGLGVTDDKNIPIDDISAHDLRVKVPGKNVTEFLKWFDSQFGREVSPSREFYEELIKPNLLDGSIFPYPNYIYLKRYQTPIHYSDHFKCDEILIADIFELKPTNSQLEELKKMISASNSEYIWVDEDKIERQGTTPGETASYTISPTSKWIL